MNPEDYIKDSLLRIKVTPNAKKTVVKGERKGVLLVDVAAPADKNKANIEIIKFFSRLLKKKVSIKKGLKSREKTLKIY